MISSFRIWRYALPLRAPASLKPGLTMSVREGLLLELLDGEGVSFWGEAAPLPGFSRESLDEAARELARVAEARVEVSSETLDPLAGAEWMTEFSDSAMPSVRFALDAASSQAAAGETFSFDFLGASPDGSPGGSLALCGLLSGGRKEILSDAARLRESGYEAVKLKVGRGGVADDAALVGEVRKALGDGVALRLDANRAWSRPEAEKFARLIEGAGVEYIEEPLEDSSRLRELSEATGLPVALDESLSEAGPRSIEDRSFAHAFVLKPTLLGFDGALRLGAGDGRPGRKPPVKSVISSSYESGVGTMALVALAAGFGEHRTAAGLDTHRRLAEDVLHPPLDLAKPRVEMDEIFGVERKVDYEKLERVS